MPKTDYIELKNAGINIPILYENRSIMIIDKPAGWILAPSHWKNTSRNLQREIEISIFARDFWARCRNLKYLRFIHRLDADTSGLLILAKNPGAIQAYNKLFLNGLIEKTYAAVVHGVPKWKKTICSLPIAPRKDSNLVSINHSAGKPAETIFFCLKVKNGKSLIQAFPKTGRTHQIRVHLSALNLPVVGDALYGKENNKKTTNSSLALRSVRLRFQDPFEKKQIDVQAPLNEFLSEYGFEIQDWKWQSIDL